MSSEQVSVPSDLPHVLKAYTKEIIRFQPDDIVAFSRDYFTALANGDVESFLKQHESQRIQKSQQNTTA